MFENCGGESSGVPREGESKASEFLKCTAGCCRKRGEIVPRDGGRRVQDIDSVFERTNQPCQIAHMRQQQCEGRRSRGGVTVTRVERATTTSQAEI